MLVNLSFRIAKPTGLTVYANNLLPHLAPLTPTLLVAEAIPGFDWYPVPPHLTADQGKKGHLSRLFWTQWQLPQIYRALKQSLIFSPIPEAPIAAGCRSVITVHDLIPLRFPQRRSPLTLYFRYWMPWVVRQATHILCNSEATAQDVQNFFQVPASRITAIPLAHDAQNFRPLDLPTQPYFIYIGRPDPHKNLACLINAFAQIPAAGGYELWIVGAPDPRYTPTLEALAAERGVAQRVKFLNYMPYAELPRLLNQAIALVFPSLWEGFGLPVLEAMACGTPVITSNLASLPEVAGDAALLVDPTNGSALADAMLQVATDAQARSQLRKAGLRRSRQFSWAKTGQVTAAVLSQFA
jgi:glycosyltransferase involved in cell wall biosynthesis